ncbi:MAG: hypothetical protein HY960_06010 [Ignavibacteriae bacterium]|nr:hypothetical protein [Ignavibacteriota bacterium]
MKSLTTIILGMLLFIFVGGVHPQHKKTFQVTDTSYSWVKRISIGKEMKLWMSNDLVLGKVAFHGNPPSDSSCGNIPVGLEYPLGSCIEHLYGGGPFIGGIINGVPHVSTAYDGTEGRTEFNLAAKDSLRNQFWLGSKKDTAYNSSRQGYYNYAMNKLCVDDDGDGNVDEDILDGEDNDDDWNRVTDDLGTDGLPDTEEQGCKGMYDPVKNPDPAFDNFFAGNYDSCLFRVIRSRDLYTQNNGIPDHGEPHVDEDYGTFANNEISFSATDTVVSDIHHQPMGIKIIQRTFYFDYADHKNTIPIEYTFVNIGSNIINDVYLGVIADMDIGSTSGYASRNYSAYSSDVRLGYTHNPVEQGATPAGITLLKASLPWDSVKIIFREFGFEPPCGGSDNTSNYRCISCSDESDLNCLFAEPPVNSPNDTRFLLSAGPFKEFRPGDTLRLCIALLTEDKVEWLIDLARRLQPYNPEEGWNRLQPPPPPLKIEQAKNSVRLRWDCNVDLTQPCYGDTYTTPTPCGLAPWSTFTPKRVIREGYRVYRSISEHYDDKSFVLLAQYDKIDGLPFGYDTGIETAFVDSNLSTGKHYWYAITAFSEPGFTIIERPIPGGTLYDTLWYEGTESDLKSNATKVYMTFTPGEKLGEVLVVPNPYLNSEDYVNGGGFEGSSSDWTPYKRMVRFIHLPSKATVRIYTIAGEVVATFQHDEAAGDIPGQHDFHLFTESGRQLANGIFVFTVESEYGRQIGKFVIAR